MSPRRACTPASSAGRRPLRGEQSAACTAGKVLPGEVTGLVLSRAGATADLAWTAPVAGGTPSGFRYDVLRADSAADFAVATTCVETDDGPDTTAADPDDPAPGAAFFYLVRARSLWGTGPLGFASSGAETIGRACP